MHCWTKGGYTSPCINDATLRETFRHARGVAPLQLGQSRGWRWADSYVLSSLYFWGNNSRWPLDGRSTSPDWA